MMICYSGTKNKFDIEIGAGVDGTIFVSYEW